MFVHKQRRFNGIKGFIIKPNNTLVLLSQYTYLLLIFQVTRQKMALPNKERLEFLSIPIYSYYGVLKMFTVTGKQNIDHLENPWDGEENIFCVEYPSPGQDSVIKVLFAWMQCYFIIMVKQK